MARNITQDLEDAQSILKCHRLIQGSLTGCTIVIGGIGYLNGYIKKFFPSPPKPLGEMAVLFIFCCKGVAFWKCHRDVEGKLEKTPFQKDGLLFGSLKGFVKRLLGTALGSAFCLLLKYIIKSTRSALRTLYRLLEEEESFQREREKKNFLVKLLSSSTSFDRKTLPVLTEVSEVLDLTFLKFLKSNITPFLIMFSLLFGVIELYEFYRCIRQIELPKSSNASSS